MALSRDAYEALEAIVGSENISEDPVILDGYAFQNMQDGREIFFGGRFAQRPEAVLLPGSTEEVQTIVKACNKYKVKFKAFSTGWGVWGAPSSEGIIQLDLRRMNRILEIDEKNMRAVVEPYVSARQLQAETVKKGLFCHSIGAGAPSSVLASATSMEGYGSDGIYMGYSGRNVLGAEWVLPTGEILRLGSLGSGAGWFCGDGPGPSLRGIMRGLRGAYGGLGVFTKCATKLYAWPGPPEIPIDGVTPRYIMPLPDNFKAYIISFPDFESFGDFWVKISRAEIGYTTHKLLTTLRDAALYMLSKLPDKTKDDIEEVMAMPETRELAKETVCSVRLVLAGHSPRHVEYQERVLNQIMSETKAHIVSFFTDFRLRGALLLSELEHSSSNEVFDFTGSYATSFGFLETPAMSAERIKFAEQLKEKHFEKVNGKVHTIAGDMAGSVYEGGEIGVELEEILYYDPSDLESSRAAQEYARAAREVSAVKGWPMGIGGPNALAPPEMAKETKEYISAPERAPLYRWQARIKRALDPNIASDPGNYLTLEED